MTHDRDLQSTNQDISGTIKVQINHHVTPNMTLIGVAVLPLEIEEETPDIHRQGIIGSVQDRDLRAHEAIRPHLPPNEKEAQRDIIEDLAVEIIIGSETRKALPLTVHPHLHRAQAVVSEV